MAAIDGNNHTSDEDWLISRAKTCLSDDQYASRAWLLTARTLFPRNLAIQFEAYNIEKVNKNVKETAKCLEQMVTSFSQEVRIWEEVVQLAEALKTGETEESKFHAGVFNSLPTQLQCHLLMSIADRAANILDKTKLMLIVLQRYPDKVAEHGIKLIDALLSAEKHAHLPTPVNCYRKYIVVDILPIVLKSYDLTPKLVYRCLQKATEFCTCYIAQPSTTQSAENTPGLLSPTQKPHISFSTQALRRMKIDGIPDSESFIPDPWGLLFDLIYSAASQLKWDITGLYHQSSRLMQLQQMSTFYNDITRNPDAAAAHKQVLYCGVPLLLHCLFQYSVQIDSEQFAGSSQNSSQRLLVLIEAPSQSDTNGPSSKKMKLDSDDIEITTSKLLSNGEEINHNLKAAFKLWEMLNSIDALKHDFQRLLQHWKSDTWAWLKSFEIDFLIYKGDYSAAIFQLNAAQSKRPNTSQLRNSLQNVTCYEKTQNYQQCVECILQVIEQLPAPVTSSSTEPTPAFMTDSKTRQLHILSCVDTEILPYCILTLLHCLKEKSFGSNPDLLSLGHMIVLAQYNWPTHQNVFFEIVDIIKKLEKFVYRNFFTYVINIDILEEFAHLKTLDSGKILLDILPTSTQVLTQQRTVTRGVNKGAKEDFRATIEKQAARSNENIQALIRQFLTVEKETIKQILK